MKIYNKLVRDKIPEIIVANGGSCATETLSVEIYVLALTAKLTEEYEEYLYSGNVEELADLLEVIYAIAKAKGVSAEELDEIREEKAAKRGRFDKRTYLKYAEY